MGQIHVLSSTLISRIAAGECIERPASVVKELVENALDAGAGRIDVSVTEGGRDLIQVGDDGRGMDADDLALSVQQHATSKLVADEDLFNIHTLGFRGEALASIGAVARLTITSRTSESDIGHEIHVEGGSVRGPRPCAAPAGTTVMVRDLFYAVPARRKFLRTNQTEMGHVTEQLARIALPQPGIALSLKSNHRVTHRLAATSDRRQRIADFYGPELAATLLPVHRESGGVRVEGLVAPPAESRGSSKWEYVFVNGRYVRDRFVSHAVKEAYRSLIDPNRYPVVFLFIAIEPAQVDVNVHPTKIEVRWRDSNFVHGQVLAALRDKFLASRLDHALRPPSNDEGYRERVRAAMVDFFTHAQPAGQQQHLMPPGASGPRPSPAEPPRNTVASAPPASPRADVPEPPAIAGVRAAARVPLEDADADSGPGFRSSPRALQVHNTYLVVETDEGLMIVDQHALHERILYEELRRRLTERQLEAQRLLMPVVVSVPPDRLAALDEHEELLARLGLELTPAGPHSVALQAFPTLLLDRVDIERFVGDLMDRLAERGSRPRTESLVHEILDMMACKAAVKAGDALTGDEIAALLARRAEAERSSHCPHGRPTTLRLTLRELEKQFHRR